MVNLICGVGINDRKYPARGTDKDTREYALWQSLLKRCYSPKVQEKQPTYTGCTVSENFKNYSYFYEWCQNQVGFGREGFQLDKDLIFKGNRVYSEDTCLFLPRELNSLLTSRRACRGDLPIGVSAHRGKFLAQCRRKPALSLIGYFNTVDEAFAAYKQAKESCIKTQAEKWKAHIDPRAFVALIAYEVSISD